MDEKKTVKVVEENDALVFFDETTNKTISYGRPIRTFWIGIDDLTAFERLDHQNSDDANSLSRSMRGKATLEDRAVAVIGDRENTSRVLEVTFRPLSDELRKQSEEKLRTFREHNSRNEAKDTFSSLLSDSPAYLDSMLCFSKSDWEIGNSDEWWLEIYLPEKAFNGLFERLIAHQIRKLSLGIKFVDIYSDSTWEPPSYKGVTWLLRPSKSDGNPYMPEPANGKVRYLSIELATSKLAAASDSAETGADDSVSKFDTEVANLSSSESIDKSEVLAANLVQHFGQSARRVATAVIVASIVVFLGLLMSGHR